MDLIRALLATQSGVVSRRQALAAGLTANDLRRMMRRRELTSVHPGVYVAHTGPLTWHQRAWAAVLAAWPAALTHESALRAADGPGRRGRGDADEFVVHVAISERRTLAPLRGVVVHRMVDLEERAQWNRSPPRLRIEDAAIGIAAGSESDLEAIAVLARVVSSRQTTAPRLQEVMRLRRRVARRAFIEAVLEDVAQGTCSVLEHGYLALVERPHGLPVAVRQAPDTHGPPLYRDVLYEDFGQVVELDGRVFHTGARDRDRDLDRDLDAAAQGLSGIRIGWGQVFGRPCRTADLVGTLLRRRGWAGVVQPCPECPPRAA